MSIHTTWQAIVSKVNEAQTLHGVFDYATGKPTGFPYATVTLSQGDAEVGSSAGINSGYNIENNTFLVRVFQEREQDAFGPEKAERVAVEVLDELLTAFHNDATLSGTVKWQLPRRWSMGYEISDQVVRTVQLEIETVAVVNSK